MVHAGSKALIAVALAACGRLGFEPTPANVDGGDAGGDAGTDAGGDAMADAGEPFACPAGYVAVPGATELGTADVCVMRTEAKAWNDANSDGLVTSDEIAADGLPTVASLPVGEYAGVPWRSISASAAFAACRGLGAGYDLISNREWMTVARNAEVVGANWSSGTPGTGRVVEGNTDGGPESGISNPLDGYSDTGNSAADPPAAGWEQRRTLVLSTGGLVWDLPGNVQEWVDWTLGGPYDGAPACTNRELTEEPCAGYVDEDYNSASGMLDRTHGAGFIIGGNGDTARRGGQVADRTQGLAGIYSLNMNRFVDDTFGATGFRCVFRP